MSRCFPFPPPGYEKKPRPEDSSVQKEEKQKEKKQKKEKKDKEKREGKEKKDKERSDGKHREKKDRKEKHKDKKDKRREKKKERSKDKDNSSTSETSKITGLPKVEKLNTEGGKDNSYSAEGKNHTAQTYVQNGDRAVQSNFIARKTEELKFAQELDKRIRVEEKITGNELVEKFSGLDRKRVDEAQRFAARNPGNLAEEKGKSRDKQFDNKKMDGQGIFSGNSMVHNYSTTTKGKVEGIPNVVEKNGEGSLGEKEKTKERGDDKWGDKHKDKDRDKRSHRKDKDREKERKKEKVKEKSEYKKSDQDKSKDVSRSGLIGVIDNKSASLSFIENKSASLSSDLHNNANVEGNLKKRKDVDINGFLHDTEVWPNKLRRPTSPQVVENGMKLETCQIPSLLASERQAVAAVRKVDEKEGRKNGIIESLPLPAAKPKSSSATADVDQIAAVSGKPPHPDSKYLSQILSVPKMDEWPEFDDQEWLFTGQDPKTRKVGASSGEEPQVWSEALHIGSADVVALPYVIPY